MGSTGERRSMDTARRGRRALRMPLDRYVPPEPVGTGRSGMCKAHPAALVPTGTVGTGAEGEDTRQHSLYPRFSAGAVRNGRGQDASPSDARRLPDAPSIKPIRVSPAEDLQVPTAQQMGFLGGTRIRAVSRRRRG